MIESILVLAAGIGLGLSIAAPPGPVNALIGFNAASGSRRSAFLVGLGALTADTIFLVLTYFVGSLIVFDNPIMFAFSVISSALLAYLAYMTIRSARKANPLSTGQTKKAKYPYLTGMTIGLTNPFQLSWWVSVGLLLISSIGPVIIAGFFIGIFSWITLFPIFISWLSRRVSSLYRIMVYASFLLLAGFSAYFLASALLLVPSLL